MLTPDATETQRRVVVVGAGGNIGSHLGPHLARMSLVDSIALIDPDFYESSNLQAQDITPRDVGKRKAVVQARRLNRINPRLRIEAIADSAERVPLGKLRADVILSCLDSRIARQHLNQFAWRLGVPLIDAGVEAGGLLARINVYMPGPDAPCLECAWDDRDYDALEQRYPCRGFASTAAATNAPSSLGALASSLQAIECQKLLAGQIDRAAASKQVLIDASYHRHYVTTFSRNPNCRFAGHEVWHIEKVNRAGRALTLDQALKLWPPAASGNGPVSFRLEGKPFVRRLICPNCGEKRSLVRLECSMSARLTGCTHCGARMIASGSDLVEDLNINSVAQDVLARTLRSLGVRDGDVFTLRNRERERHYELTNR